MDGWSPSVGVGREEKDGLMKQTKIATWTQVRIDMNWCI